MRPEIPRRVEVRAAVPAQVDGEDSMPARQTFLCEPPKPPSVAADPVEADDGRPARLAPLVNVQEQAQLPSLAGSSPLPVGV